MNSVERTAYEQGRYAAKACAEGLKPKPNPYPEGSGAFGSWNDGWNDEREGEKKMREIEFKAWNTVEKKMEDKIIISQNGEVLVVEYGNITASYAPGTYILLQYTGEKDVNDKKICDGDRVKFTVFDCFGRDTKHTGVIRFAYGEWQIWQSADSEFYGDNGAFSLCWVCRQDDEIEVIGNIWEEAAKGEEPRQEI